MAAAIERAIDKHPSGIAAERSVAAARARVDRMGAAWLPQVRAVGQVMAIGPVPTLSINTGLTVPGAAGPLQIEQELGQAVQISGALEVAWRAYDFGARSKRADAARAGISVSQADGAGKQVELAWAVRRAYAAARYFDTLVKVNGQAITTAERDVALAKARLEVGLGARVDVAAAESRRGERVARKAQADAGRARARTTLRSLLDMDSVQLEDDLATLASAPITKIDEATPAELQVRAAAAAKGAEAEALDADFWPTLDLVGSAGYSDPLNFAEPDSGFSWRAGARLVWPLFDGDNRRRHRVQVKAEQASLMARAAVVVEGRARAAADAKARWGAARLTKVAAEDSVAAAETWVTAARAALEAGSATALDIERAVDRLDGARLAVARARLDAANARADHLRADGVVLEPAP